ncbi:glycosyl transferase family 1 family protein [Dorcoceras hygrometricum]|uniref:Glycosyl transferase family 1 family protein n=1 Tax=Dorcoceras hygrometricum TaxID=472368 RepID=A0A2Z7A324_9LAMI|nr:glycosyl transferase family 1 family protein [Dorcoceras hygrometricum]
MRAGRARASAYQRTGLRNCCAMADSWPLLRAACWAPFHDCWSADDRAGDARWSRITANRWPLLHLLLRAMARSWPVARAQTVVRWSDATCWEAPLLVRLGRASCCQRAAECRTRFVGGGLRRAAAVRRMSRQRCDD